MAVRVGKYRSHDAQASCEDFDARGGHASLTRRAGRFCMPASLKILTAAQGYACGFRLVGLQKRSGQMGSNHWSLVLRLDTRQAPDIASASVKMAGMVKNAAAVCSVAMAA